MSTFAERQMADRQGDFEVERFDPTPQDILRSHGIDPELPREQLGPAIEAKWNDLTPAQREILSEADLV